MSIKIGTDIVAIERIANAIEKFGDKFLKRFLNKSERAAIKSVQSAAGYWAAKEAIAKALECGIGKELSFLDIEIRKKSTNAPYFVLKAQKLQVESSSLSISHDGGFAIAVVAIEMA